MKKRILLVFGTRPEAIKMAPLYVEFKKHTQYFEVMICVTGQHRQMLDQVLGLFDIRPEYDLDIMQQGQDLYDITSKVLLGMRDVLNESKPDLILVHGDTSTSTATALSAFYQQIPVGHVEAGLRTYNIYSPWPEEINRQLTGRISSFHFAPTQKSKNNLISEGVLDETIDVTGNTVIDSLYWVLDRVNNDHGLRAQINKDLISSGLPNYNIDSWEGVNGHSKRKMILITGHRRENFGDGFLNICKAIKYLSNKYTFVDFVYPMHLNPNVRLAIQTVFGPLDVFKKETCNVFFIEPLDYLPFVKLMNSCYIILTDSGGIQEEAPSLGKPVLVMRDTTERPEALEEGTVRLVGTNELLIINSVEKLIEDEKEYTLMSGAKNPYGDGLASARIIDSIKRKFRVEE